LLIVSSFTSVIYCTYGKRKRQTKKGKEETQEGKEERQRQE